MWHKLEKDTVRHTPQEGQCPDSGFSNVTLCVPSRKSEALAYSSEPTRRKRVPAFAGGGAVCRQRFLLSAEALLLRILYHIITKRKPRNENFGGRSGFLAPIAALQIVNFVLLYIR